MGTENFVLAFILAIVVEGDIHQAIGPVLICASAHRRDFCQHRQHPMKESNGRYIHKCLATFEDRRPVAIFYRELGVRAWGKSGARERGERGSHENTWLNGRTLKPDETD